VEQRCAGIIFFSMEEETNLISWEHDICTSKNSITVRRMVFVSESMSCTHLRGRWCNINLFNVHTSSEEKINDSKEIL
jgi:hypothetical protein